MLPPPHRSSLSSRFGLAAIVMIAGLASAGCHACVALLALSDDGDEGSSGIAAGPAAPGETAKSVAAGDPTTDPAPTHAASPAPTPQPSPAAAPTGASAGGPPAGRYECFAVQILVGPRIGQVQTKFVPGALPAIVVDGAGGYTASGGSGSVTASGSLVTFTGGHYDGWRAAASTNSSGYFLRFRGKSPSDPKVGDTTRHGDYQCYLQKPK
jgi:hypothetical protein